MDSQPIAIDFDRPVPLFPLPDCVLLPYVIAPLHVFEPRYGQLVADMIHHQRMLLAMSVFQGEQWKQDYQGSPPLRPYACLGYVVRHALQEDGRFNLLIQGLCRVRLMEEVSGEPYRQALVQPMEEPILEPDFSGPMQQVMALADDPLLSDLSPIVAARRWAERGLPPQAMLDIFSFYLSDRSEQRYQLLQESDASTRMAWLLNELQSLRRTMATAHRVSGDDGQRIDRN